jgi:hypothetical protein
MDLIVVPEDKLFKELLKRVFHRVSSLSDSLFPLLLIYVLHSKATHAAAALLIEKWTNEIEENVDFNNVVVVGKLTSTGTFWTMGPDRSHFTDAIPTEEQDDREASPSVHADEAKLFTPPPSPAVAISHPAPVHDPVPTGPPAQNQLSRTGGTSGERCQELRSLRSSNPSRLLFATLPPLLLLPPRLNLLFQRDVLPQLLAPEPRKPETQTQTSKKPQIVNNYTFSFLLYGSGYQDVCLCIVTFFFNHSLLR